MVRVRIAPSPTGIPHIGNTWVALFNFLFAKKNNGKFILRLEDTDRERLVPESIDKIYETLHWLGLTYDEGPDVGGKFAPYIQSQRLEFYQKYAGQLVDKGLAYKDQGATRFRTSKEGKISWLDLVGNKNIEFDNTTQEDFVILKSDGFPTYHLASVVDDHLMEISHVIRGGEWISSTPKHIMLYQAFGWQLPKFAHLPLLLGPDRTKLSKRHGAKSVLEFREEGYLREALLNFMALLGWSPPAGREILTIEEMIEEFDLKDVNLASPIFDVQKLTWLNGEYIRKLKIKNLKLKIWEYLGKTYPDDLIEKTVPLVKDRIKKLSDYMDLAGFFFDEPKIDQKLFDKNAKEHLKTALDVIETAQWATESLQKSFLSIIKQNKFTTGDFFMTLRIAITGSKITPPIVESIIILGKDRAKNRIVRALRFLK